MSSLPPALAVGALYDTFLQNALKQFFSRATFEAEPVMSASSDGRLAIEPSDDPCALMIRWFGMRYTLRVPERRPFTEHETRFARAIGAVLAARYRAILNPKLMVERGDLFRGAIEDRYVGAFLDEGSYEVAQGEPRADRIASAIEVLRVAALSSYENRPISTGVLLLGDDRGAAGSTPSAAPQSSGHAHLYSEALTGVKSFFRLVDGLQTLFLVAPDGRLMDIVDIRHWAVRNAKDTRLPVPCPVTYQAHALATLNTNHVCIVLSPSHEIKVFAQGAYVLAYRHARWRLLDLQSKYELWAAAVGNETLALALFRCALDLADARKGALFVVLRDPAETVDALVSPSDRLDIAPPESPDSSDEPTRRDLLYLLTGRTAIELEPTVLAALASLDGAMVTDDEGNLIAAGAILRHPDGSVIGEDAIVEGARTTAAMAASQYGPVLKVSEDGGITFFDGEKIWDV
ncbi:MAG TPA: hypothetical protein VNK41_06790 [Vicinamibacterales bacterium]|nr:hypothetical protein [Vicinamibacterales bacterium]